MTSTRPSPDADHMVDHWWWRPGWHVGTRFYAWHITIDTQPAIADRIETYQHALADIETLDPIPRRWLHLTVQGVGHRNDITIQQRDRVIAAVDRRLADIPPPTGVFEHPVVHAESVLFPPNDPGPLTTMRNAIRAGITDALGTVTETDTFRPHVSIAYSNAQGDPAAIRQRLDTIPPQPIPATFHTVSLILMHRDNRQYEWNTIHNTPIGHPT